MLPACAIPLGLIIGLGSELMPRHYVVCLPILLVLAGGGLGRLFTALPAGSVRLGTQIAAVGALVVAVMPFMLLAYTIPDQLPLTVIEQHQYLIDYSAGYGLREAVLDFPNTIGSSGTPVIASMYADGCRRANFYDVRGFNMR